jgi:hypothetical protein
MNYEKELDRNQVSPITPGLHPELSHSNHPTAIGTHGGARRGAGRPKGSPNKVTQTFRDALLQAVSEVGDSREEGKDGEGGLLGYLKKAAIREERTTLVLLGRILPLKISAEVKQLKEKMTIQEAVAQMKAHGLDELLAFYLHRYPLEPDDDPTWAEGIQPFDADKLLNVIPDVAPDDTTK